MLAENLHLIFEDECYSQNEFESFMHVYSVVTDYIKYYNERRRHGSIKFMSPHKFYAAFIDDTVKVKPFTASSLSFKQLLKLMQKYDFMRNTEILSRDRGLDRESNMYR